MYAPSPVSERQSRISINFGEKITSQNNPFELDAELEFYSQKNQSIRFNLEELLGIKIKDFTIVLEIIAKNGSGSQIAQKFNNFLKTNQYFIQKTKKDGVQPITITAKGEICYVIAYSQNKQDTQKLHQYFIELQKGNPGIEKVNSSIKIQIKSLNSCDYVRKLLDNQGITRAFNDSLNLELRFEKTKLIETLLNQFLSKIGMKQLDEPLKACKKLNLNLNFASSSEQDRFQHLRVCLKKGEKQEFALFKQIKGQYKDQVHFSQIQIKFYMFDPFLSFSGKCHAENAASLLEAFYE